MRTGWAWLLGCILLAGCGGSDYSGDPGDVPEPSPAGYYAGTLLSDNGFDVRAVALVTADGQVRIIGTGFGIQYLTALPASGSDWRAPLQGYTEPNASRPYGVAGCTGRVDASAFPAAELLGEYRCGSDRGSFDLVYDDNISFDPPDPAELTGAAQGVILPHDIVVLIIAPDGSYTGSDTLGCMYSGSFAAADPIIGLYTMQLEQDCGGTPLHLSGTAALGVDPASGSPALYYGVSDAGHSLVGVLVFQ